MYFKRAILRRTFPRIYIKISNPEIQTSALKGKICICWKFQRVLVKDLQATWSKYIESTANLKKWFRMWSYEWIWDGRLMKHAWVNRKYIQTLSRESWNEDIIKMYYKIIRYVLGPICLRTRTSGRLHKCFGISRLAEQILASQRILLYRVH